MQFLAKKQRKILEAVPNGAVKVNQECCFTFTLSEKAQ
jgi:hypothetical protein